MTNDEEEEELESQTTDDLQLLDSDGSQPPLISGKLVVSVVIGLGILGAASAWLYHYDEQRKPRLFWGFESLRIFDESQVITAYLIEPERPSAAERPRFYETLYMIDDQRYVVLKKKEVTHQPGLDFVREHLRKYQSYDFTERSWQQPLWRYGLIFENTDPENPIRKYTASIVFDAECKFGKPQTVDKIVSTAPMSAGLLEFFQAVFPEAKHMPTSYGFGMPGGQAPGVPAAPVAPLTPEVAAPPPGVGTLPDQESPPKLPSVGPTTTTAAAPGPTAPGLDLSIPNSVTLPTLTGTASAGGAPTTTTTITTTPTTTTK